MIKRIMMISTMMGAVGLPYLLSTGGEWLGSVKSRFTSTSETSLPASQPGPTSPVDGRPAPYAQVAAATPRGKPLPPEGYPTNDLAEVIHFNGTPTWVMTRWPRVTTGLSQLELQGYRVALVTGTNQDDLAGSLTYYFDKQQQVRFLTFRGTTGNPHKIVSLVTSRFQFVQQPTSDPSMLLFQVKWNGNPTSELRIRTAHVITAAQPNARYDIELAMKRP